MCHAWRAVFAIANCDFGHVVNPESCTCPTLGTTYNVPTSFAHAQIATISFDEIVEIVINNRPASEGNEGGPGNSTFMMQHPMHLHGHKFWLLGLGEGVYNESVHERRLNKYNPILRDTMTLPIGYWAVLRFRADNPGVWPFHCHNLWHGFMGQQMYIIEGAGLWPPRPEGFGNCPDTCITNFGAFTNDWFDKSFGSQYDHA